MAKKLQFKFDPNQDYQLEAIQSVVRVFDDLPHHTTEFALGGDIVPNLPAFQTLHESWLYDNVCAIQEENKIPSPMMLDVDDGLVLEGAGNESWRYPSFTIEMETGTGKTYVYLRTIYELHKHYGFRKYIIVVPSIAIYEGTIKNLKVTQGHFRALYGNETVNLVRYDGSRLSSLRTFAASTFVEIMVMTIDSFNKKANTIYKPSEQLPGERLPFQYIQEARPILILDEPQNMESERSKEALRTLHPLFALRYSATHRATPNLLYQLTPFEAFQRNLVKKIQVDGVTQRDDFNQPFLALQSITTQSGITATVRTYVSDNGRTREESITLRHGDDLYAKTDRQEYQEGYRVVEINAGTGFVEFENTIKLHLDETIGPSRPEIFRVQIERTIEQHMQTQDQLLDDGIKVLSLFFIDRVANYVDEDGIIKRLFDEAFEKYKLRFPHFRQLNAHQVREAYFAKQKKKGTDEEEVVDTGGRTKAEREAERTAFELIMRDKERLLSLEEPVSFIFAHSALKEGWDNPNVFQICTLNQTISEMKKRQEIGRGLRLPVNQEGERIFDEDVNILTVIANESYESYAACLQSEYVEDGQSAPPPPSKVGHTTVTRNDKLYNSNLFQGFWEKLSQPTQYHINIDTPALVENCLERLNNRSFPKPVIVVERGRFVVTNFTLTLESISAIKAKIRVKRVDTNGEESIHAGFYERSMDLSKVHNDPRLRGFKVQSLIEAGDNSKAVFDNGTELHLYTPFEFDSESGQVPQERAVLAPEHSYSVFNLLDRVAKETGLTRPTINQIFRGLNESRKEMLFKNPEGFASLFVTEIKNALADHIVERIEFVVADGQSARDLSELFPPTKRFPQRELVEAGEHGLYDQVQSDSGVESNFVERRLRNDDRVIGYFKFPSKFKIPFPTVIGNYNPDWGILRYKDDGTVVAKLVRETKGTEELEQLQFPHERRKIEAAQKHFDEIGVDYRVVTDDTENWWYSEDDIPSQASLPT